MFCVHHSGPRSRKRPSAESLSPDPPVADVSREILGPIRDFRTAAAINHALGKLLILSASNLVAPRQAAVLAYICQLLLQTLGDVKHEVGLTRDPNDVEKELRRVLKATASLHAESDAAIS